MKSKILASAVCVASLLVLAAGTCAMAQVQVQERGTVRFSGPINDYSPSTVKGGPWEMHGQWSLDVSEVAGTADFYADMTMSDYGTTAAGTVDPTQAGQNGHTHHIRLTAQKITWDMTGCPTFSPPAQMGFQVNGTVSLMTGNGSNAPFETTPPSSVLQICITGGETIPYSVANANMTMVFTGPATKHFGTQAIHGVVGKTTILPVARFPGFPR